MELDLFNQKAFHNSIHLEGEELAAAALKANSLEVLVYGYFKSHPTQEFTPIQVWKNVCPENLLASCRRAMSNLKNRRLLVKTENRVPEKYGSPNYTYKLNTVNE